MLETGRIQILHLLLPFVACVGGRLFKAQRIILTLRLIFILDYKDSFYQNVLKTKQLRSQKQHSSDEIN